MIVLNYKQKSIGLLINLIYEQYTQAFNQQSSNFTQSINLSKHSITNHLILIPHTTKMKNLQLEIFLNPLFWSTVWGTGALMTEVKKTFIQDEEIYKHLKEDIVNVHKQDLHEGKKDPVLQIVKEKRANIDPELKKKLDIYQEWQRDNLWVIGYKYAAVLVPAFLGTTMFPRFTAAALCALAFLNHINYVNDREILSNGREKSIFKKDVLPRQDRVLEGFRYVAFGIAFMTLFKLGMIKYNQKMTAKMLNDWKKQNQSK